MPKKIYLFTLQTFSATGGIQKMTRTLAHSLQHISTGNSWRFQLWSVYDKPEDLMPRYLPASHFQGYGSKKLKFLWSALKIGWNADVVFISHINLSVIGVITKIINPRCKVFLVAHGIEVWRPLRLHKRMIMRLCDKIICVSNFTQEEIMRRHRVNNDRCEVFNNAVDPFMTLPNSFEKPQHLLKKYNLDEKDTILFTLTRLAATEQYKGYEQIIRVIDQLKETIPSIKYVLSGQYDPAEKERINNLIQKYHVGDRVILTGFIKEEELTDHFLLADLFALPSKKEGFGIVFIEALACGLPVVCGNVDGSMDAIKGGKLGKAVNPDDLHELALTLSHCLKTPIDNTTRKYLQQECLHYFNENDYMHKLQRILIQCLTPKSKTGILK